MDKRIDYKIVLDTETCPIEKSDKVSPFNMLTYDIGWLVTDKQGRIYKTRSFVIYEIFIGEAEKMKSAYYADKIPKYWDDIRSGKRQLVRFATARRILLEDMREYNINKIFAHNMFFDYNTLNKTTKWINKKYYYFFPFAIYLFFYLEITRNTINQKEKYKKY